MDPGRHDDGDHARNARSRMSAVRSPATTTTMPITGAATLELAGPADITLVDAMDRTSPPGQEPGRSRDRASGGRADRSPRDRGGRRACRLRGGHRRVSPAAAGGPHRHEPTGDRRSLRAARRRCRSRSPRATIGADVEVGTGTTIRSGAMRPARLHASARARKCFPGAVLYGERAGSVLDASGPCRRRVRSTTASATEAGSRGSAISSPARLMEPVRRRRDQAQHPRSIAAPGPTVIGAGTEVDNLGEVIPPRLPLAAAQHDSARR